MTGLELVLLSFPAVFGFSRISVFVKPRIQRKDVSRRQRLGWADWRRAVEVSVKTKQRRNPHQIESPIVLTHVNLETSSRNGSATYIAEG